MGERSGDPLVKELEEKMLAICEAHPQGLTDKEITQKLGTDVKPLHRSTVYNRLLKAGRLRLAESTTARSASGKKVVLYQWVSAKEASKFKGLNPSECMVYQVIERGGQDGATKRQIRSNSNIQNSSELKQIVERLIARGLVKEIKSVQGTNKRVYVISELEPSKAHTGGPWYNEDQELDSEFINAIYEQVLKFIGTTAFANVDEVTNYVAEIKLSNETLAQSDIKALMTTMLWDGVIEYCEGRGDGSEYYRKTQATPAVNHLVSIPCGSCPVFHDCRPDGLISPKTCIYMDDWLKQTTDW